MSDPKQLTLRAQIEGRFKGGTRVHVSQNRALAGFLMIDDEFADQVVGILNAGADLLAACKAEIELDDYLALGPLGAAAKYGPDHDFEIRADRQCHEVRGLLEAAVAKAGPLRQQAERANDE